jgi:hypothetical protein
MEPTGMTLCIQKDQLTKQETIVGTLAIILPVLGATQWIPKYQRMSVMCVIVINQVQIDFINNIPSGYVCFFNYLIMQ